MPYFYDSTINILSSTRKGTLFNSFAFSLGIELSADVVDM